MTYNYDAQHNYVFSYTFYRIPEIAYNLYLLAAPYVRVPAYPMDFCG